MRLIWVTENVIEQRIQSIKSTEHTFGSLRNGPDGMQDPLQNGPRLGGRSQRRPHL
jgi:hypothetical protein